MKTKCHISVDGAVIMGFVCETEAKVPEQLRACAYMRYAEATPRRMNRLGFERRKWAERCVTCEQSCSSVTSVSIPGEAKCATWALGSAAVFWGP